MPQPSRSGVMHAYFKVRAREGMGTAVPARARLHPRVARTGMHGTGGACRCLHELLALRRCAASTRPALVVDCGIFRKLPCLQTRYIVERAADASLGARIGPAQPLASVRGVCRKPASYSMNFDLLRVLEHSKKAGLRIPAHVLENAGSPGSAYNFKCLLPPASCFQLLNLGCCSSARKNAGSRKQGAQPTFLNPASCKNPLSRWERRPPAQARRSAADTAH
jgi:hypothetical protein